MSSTNDTFWPFKKDTWIVLTLQLLCIGYCFYGGTDTSSIRKWENASILVTIAYAVAIYGKLIKKRQLMSTLKVHLGVIICFIIIFIYGGILFDHFNFITIHTSVDREEKMWGICIGTMAFLVINVIVLKPHERLLPIKRMLFYSDIPVFTSFLALSIYAAYIDINNMSQPEKSIWDAFFAGAVAFQMLCSNVIWAFNDDTLFSNNN